MTEDKMAGWHHRLDGRPLLIATGEAIPLRGLEGVPGLPGAPQDEAGLTRKFDQGRRGSRCSILGSPGESGLV